MAFPKLCTEHADGHRTNGLRFHKYVPTHAPRHATALSTSEGVPVRTRTTRYRAGCNRTKQPGTDIQVRSQSWFSSHPLTLLRWCFLFPILARALSCSWSRRRPMASSLGLIPSPGDSPSVREHISSIPSMVLIGPVIALLKGKSTVSAPPPTTQGVLVSWIKGSPTGG